MTKEIKLTQGQVAMVDDWRYDELNQHKWYAWWNPCTKSFYAMRKSCAVGGGQATIRMHAVVAGTPNGMKTDHIDRNTLNNTEENLRVCTTSQNQQNRGKTSGNTSGYCGVIRYGTNWRAQIASSGRHYYLGTYPTAEEAAYVYDEAAKELHGEFAVLNFPRHTSDN